MRTQQTSKRWQLATGGFVVAEAIMAIAILAMLVSTILMGYVSSSRRLAWASNSAAAQALAITTLEQAFGAQWASSGVTDETNLLSLVQTNAFVLNGTATNYLTITDISTNLPKLRLFKVSCVWSYQGKSYTNTVAAARAPKY